MAGLAAPPDPDDTWLQFIHAGYYDAALGTACLFCNPNPIVTEEGELEDTGTSAAPPNTGRKKKEKVGEKSGKDCKRFFCVPCKQGGLCVNEFDSEDHLHFGHPHLQIFRTSYENSVRKNDIAPFLSTTGVLGITSNDHTVHLLHTRKPTTANSNVMQCEGCREKVATAKSSRFKEENAREARMCSIECLLKCRARNRPMPRPVPAPVNGRNRHQRKQGTPMRSPQ